MFKNIFSLFVFFLVLSMGVCYGDISAAEERSPFAELETLLKIVTSDEGEKKIEIKKFAVELVQNDPERIFKVKEVNRSKPKSPNNICRLSC